jgi:hypothetical protein
MKKRQKYFKVLFLLVLVSLLGGWTVGAAVAASEGTPSGEVCEKEGRGTGFKPEPFGEVCIATFGPIITDTAVPIEKGMFAVQPTFGLSFITSRFNKDWERVSAGGDFTSFAMEWKFTYGLLNNLEVFVVIPYIHNWASNVAEPGPRGEYAASSGDLGDINLTFKYGLLAETQTRPTVTFLFATDFPSGRFRGLNPGLLETEVTGGGAYVFTTGLNLSKYVRPFMLYGNVWYSMQTAFTDDEGRQYPRDFVTVNLAAELPFTRKWVALFELTSFWDGGRLFGHQANVASGALLSVLPGIEYMATEKFSLALGVNVDLVGKNADTAVTPLLSMVYAF